jgi:hypothetical protein
MLTDLRDLWYTQAIGAPALLMLLMGLELPLGWTAFSRARSWGWRVPLLILGVWSASNAVLVYPGSPLTLERLVWHSSVIVLLIVIARQRRVKRTGEPC